MARGLCFGSSVLLFPPAIRRLTCRASSRAPASERIADAVWTTRASLQVVVSWLASKLKPLEVLKTQGEAR